MNTIIELYDRQPLNNYISSFVLKPKNTVFLCAKKYMDRKNIANAKQVFKAFGLNTRISFVETDEWSSEDILKSLNEVLDRFPDACIDVNGGSSLLTVAVGMLLANRPVPVFSIDRERGVFINIYNCPQMDAMPAKAALNVRQILAMTGSSFSRSGHISNADITEKLLSQVEPVWDIVSKNKTEWSKLVGYLQRVSKLDSNAGLSVDAPLRIKDYDGKALYCSVPIMTRLAKAGLIRNFRLDGERVKFDYPSNVLKRCLNEVGVWIELYVYKTAVSLERFSDVQISVIVDWDGFAGGEINTINEIDIVLVRDMSPVFISCKAGNLNTQILNEIFMIKQRFGIGDARAAVVTLSDVSNTSPATWQRAADLNITIIEEGDLQSGRLGEILSEM